MEWRWGLSRAAFLMALLLVVAGGGVASANEPIRFGSVAMDTPRAMHQLLLPLTRYLEETLHRPVELVISPNMPATIDDVTSRRVDVAYLTPMAYVRAHEAVDARLVVKTVTNHKDTFRLMVVAKENSAIRSMEDLKGKRFAFGDPAAMLQRAVVVGAGFQLADFGEYTFLNHYDNIVRGVLRGDFDAGILKDTVAQKWVDKGVRIIYSSPELPPFNITAGPSVDQALWARLRDAFVRLDINNPHHYAIIKSLDLRYTGFTSTDDSEYEVVRGLIAPFSKSGNVK